MGMFDAVTEYVDSWREKEEEWRTDAASESPAPIALDAEWAYWFPLRAAGQMWRLVHELLVADPADTVLLQVERELDRLITEWSAEVTDAYRLEPVPYRDTVAYQLKVVLGTDLPPNSSSPADTPDSTPSVDPPRLGPQRDDRPDTVHPVTPWTPRRDRDRTRAHQARSRDRDRPRATRDTFLKNFPRVPVDAVFTDPEGIARAFGVHRGGMPTVRDAYDVSYEYLGPYWTWVAGSILADLRREIAENPRRRVAFVGRDGHVMAAAVRGLDPDFFAEHCCEIVLSRGAMELMMVDWETIHDRDFPIDASFRTSSTRIDRDAAAGAVDAMDAYLRDERLEVGPPGSALTLVDNGLRGSGREILAARYPDTDVRIHLAFLSISPDDRPDGKKGHVFELPAEDWQGGVTWYLPHEHEYTFLCNQALAAMECVGQGPLPEASGWTASGPDQTRPEDFGPYLTLPRAPAEYRVPGVLEAAKTAVLLAVHDYARSVRDRPTNDRNLLTPFTDQVRGYLLNDGTVDRRMAALMDSVVPHWTYPLAPERSPWNPAMRGTKRYPWHPSPTPDTPRVVSSRARVVPNRPPSRNPTPDEPSPRSGFVDHLSAGTANNDLPELLRFVARGNRIRLPRAPLDAESTGADPAAIAEALRADWRRGGFRSPSELLAVAPDVERRGLAAVQWRAHDGLTHLVAAGRSFNGIPYIYDPAAGRFASHDPWWIGDDEIDTWHETMRTSGETALYGIVLDDGAAEHPLAEGERSSSTFTDGPTTPAAAWPFPDIGPVLDELGERPPTVAEIMPIAQDLADRYPHCELQQVGISREGTPMWTMTVHADEPDAPTALAYGLAHSNEPWSSGTVEALMRYTASQPAARRTNWVFLLPGLDPDAAVLAEGWAAHIPLGFEAAIRTFHRRGRHRGRPAQPEIAFDPDSPLPESRVLMDVIRRYRPDKIFTFHGTAIQFPVVGVTDEVRHAIRRPYQRMGRLGTGRAGGGQTWPRIRLGQDRRVCQAFRVRESRRRRGRRADVARSTLSAIHRRESGRHRRGTRRDPDSNRSETAELPA
jgi:hypothetical protein